MYVLRGRGALLKSSLKSWKKIGIKNGKKIKNKEKLEEKSWKRKLVSSIREKITTLRFFFVCDFPRSVAPVFLFGVLPRVR